MDNKTAIDKAVDTIASIKAELDAMSTYDGHKLNEVEGRIRVELQVMEALVNHVGREVYQAVQVRRQQLRSENQQWIKDTVSPVEERVRAILGDKKEEDNEDGTRNSGTNGDTGGTDKPGGVKQEGDTKAKRPSRQSKSKK